jgi:hypothetical protein
MDNLDLEEFKNKLSQTSEEKLCEIIATNRYLGIMKDAAILSMQELATRRQNGNIYPYEEKIEKIIKSLPPIDLKIKSIFQKRIF